MKNLDFGKQVRVLRKIHGVDHVGVQLTIQFKGVNIMSGKITLPHTCPRSTGCPNKTTASTEKELAQKFGYRKIPDGLTNQSWCKKCRSEPK